MKERYLMKMFFSIHRVVDSEYYILCSWHTKAQAIFFYYIMSKRLKTVKSYPFGNLTKGPTLSFTIVTSAAMVYK